MVRKQTVYWFAVLVPAFVAVALVLRTLQVSPFVAFAAGIFFAEIGDTYADWLVDWVEAEQRIEEVAPDDV